MEKKRFRVKNMKIFPSFVLIMLVFLILGMLLTEVESTLLHNAQMSIAFHYSDEVKGYDESRVWRDNEVFVMTSEDSKNIQLLQMGLNFLPAISYLVCAMLAGLLFYRTKVKKPLQLLNKAAQNISTNNLDFHISYDKCDEMGTLCQSFETMRKALEENSQEMWRQVNERKWMNASFSHDMKTPLTILEGNLEMLQKYSDNGMMTAEDVKEAYVIMEAQVTRIGDYINSMNTLAQIADLPIEKKKVSLSGLVETLHETAKAVVNGKELLFHNHVKNGEMLLDQEIVIRIYENLLSNAFRFAKSLVEITIDYDSNELSICVEDDGNGFDEKSLERATEAFYSTEKKVKLLIWVLV